MRKLLLLILACISFSAQSQKLYGTIKNDKGEPLPFASIIIKGTSKGTSANDKANYSLYLQPGSYIVLCQHIGYTAVEKKITLDKDLKIDFELQEQKLSLQEVVVKTGGEDPAYAIIRNAIKKREFHNKELQAFSCNYYAKDIIRLRGMPEKFFGQKIKAEDRKDMGVDSTGKGIIYLSENIATVYRQQPDKLKMEVQSSRVSGSNSFGFTFPTFISLYKNNVMVFVEQFNPRGFVSPISDGAIGFYKYKFLGSFFENGKEINTIRVTPRRNYEPLFSGTIFITENEWRIHSFNLMVTKKSQLELLDTLQITQLHVPVGQEKWMVKNQVIRFSAKMFGFDVLGNFLNVYSDYNISPSFDKKFFDKVLIKYDTAVTKQKAYWDSVRPVPLEKEEALDYKVKDSTFKLKNDSLKSRRVLDSLNKKQKPLNVFNLLRNDYHRTHYDSLNTYYWGVNSILPNLEYNSVEGIVANAGGYFSKNIRWLKSSIRFEPYLRYGFSNHHFNAWGKLYLSRFGDEGNKYSILISGGKRISEFNKQSSIFPLVNTFSTLLYGKNYMKLYENYFGKLQFSRNYQSGLQFNTSLLYEDRLPLENSSTFTVWKKDSINITPNFPIEKLTQQFNRHQALVFNIGFRYQPGMQYIQFPRYKAPIGSKYPTFSLNFSKGINSVLGSDVNFDKWDFSIEGDKNFKLKGKSDYKIGIGGFLNSKNVPLQDYRHFNGNRVLAASEYVNSFQLAPYYANSTTEKFYATAHLEHHFNGLLTNKIPLFRKLHWNLVGGTNAFYVTKQNNYVEVFAGIENIFKIFRVDFIAAYSNGQKGLTGIRIGAGGMLGSGVQVGGLKSRLRGNF